MKKVFAVLFCIVLIPSFALSMEILSDTELDAVTARATGPSEPSEASDADFESRENSSRRDMLTINSEPHNSEANNTETGANRMCSGVAIMIDDVVIYSNNAGREIWYQNGSASVGMVSK